MRTEVRDQRAEDRSQRAEIRDQRSEGRGEGCNRELVGLLAPGKEGQANRKRLLAQLIVEAAWEKLERLGVTVKSRAPGGQVVLNPASFTYRHPDSGE